MDKPMILKIEEVKNTLINTINDAIQGGIPCYFLEPIVSDVLVQVKAGAKVELQKALEVCNSEKTE